MKKVIRYIGSKEKLLDFLSEVIFKNHKNIKFLDAFTGTTVVSKYLQETTQYDLSLSDISNYSEILSSRLYISKCTSEIFEYINMILMLSEMVSTDDSGVFFNEFSMFGNPKTINQLAFENQEIKSRMFFTNDVGLKIDAMRSYIKNLYVNNKINKYEKNLLLMLVVAFADKNANTTSVYGAYLKNQNRETVPLKNEFVDILQEEFKKGYKSPINYYKSDIIQTLENIEEQDVIYLDPPYTTRRYESNYHILNYLCDLDFTASEIKENSKTGLPKHSINNMFGSKKNTKIIFEDMILKSMNKSKELYISYSTDGEMTFEEINDICSDNKLILDTYTKDYKKYTSNNNDKSKDLKEIIYRIKK